jgi:hypothetical protein
MIALFAEVRLTASHNQSTNNSPYYLVENFKLSSPKNGARFIAATGSAGSSQVRMVNGEISGAGSTAPNTGVIGVTNIRFWLEIVNVRFTGFVIGTQLAIVDNTLAGVISFIQCDFGNVSQRGPYFPQLSPAAGRMGTPDCAITIHNRGENKDFSIDTHSGFCEWNSARAFPTANARLPDGITPYSVRAIAATGAGKVVALNPFRLPRFSKINTLPDGQRTFTLNFIAEQTLVLSNQDVSMFILYVDSSGVQRQLTSPIDTNPIPTSTLTWSSESGGLVTFQESGTVSHSKYKLEVTTPVGQDLKLGTEVSVWVSINKIMPDTTKTLFFDPEIMIS